MTAKLKIKWLMPSKYRTLKLGMIFLAILLAIGSFSNNQKSQARSAVDLLLVIALDVSASVDDGEYALMIDGLSKVFSSAQIAQAISAGKYGAIGVSIMQWSGFTEQKVKIAWTRVGSQTELLRLAANIKQMKRRYDGGATDIGGSIDFSVKLFEKENFSTARRVIDIVGDGPNNVNFSPSQARDRAVKTGIIINALVVTGRFEVLADYFVDVVIGGPGAFVEKTGDFDGFERAIHRKLLREIGSLYLF
ncbi:MAG: DUF1194 domain-containing protein [Hyphomicrobiales bacterium]|nr:DUF1194 domain-containing protein [Hyphomicrobiales bacterium]